MNTSFMLNSNVLNEMILKSKILTHTNIYTKCLCRIKITFIQYCRIHAQTVYNLSGKLLDEELFRRVELLKNFENWLKKCT